MIEATLKSIFYAFALAVFLLGVQSLFFFPLTLIYEIWKKRKLRSIPAFAGPVTVLVPAYNEEKTIRASLASILASDYPSLEIIVINDGSTDRTEDQIRDYAESGQIRYIGKPNGGKASALNRGIAAARGEIILYTDADSFFHRDTVRGMVRWFGDPEIAAVCGNDAPLNPATPLQKLLVVTTHIGTGFVRRALSVIGCLPIITGNLGAIRTSVLREIKGFREVWGEDLEITFRLHKKRERIIFDPEPSVLAECPATAMALWKQRVRWMRSYIKIASLHRDLFFNPRYRPFAFYLPVNFVNMTIVPLLQLALLVLMPGAVAGGYVSFYGTLDVLAYTGILFFVCVAAYGILLDRDARDLLYLPYGLLILPFSYFYSAVTAFSWWKEFHQSEETWEKIERRKIMQIGRREISGWTVLLSAVFLMAGSSAATYLAVRHQPFERPKPVQGDPARSQELSPRVFAAAAVAEKTDTPPGPSVYRPVLDLALSTHFEAWDDWHDALRSVLGRPRANVMNIVGIGAGRPEWVYFKWEGRAKDWANNQRGTKADLLRTATDEFHAAGLKVAAIIDMNAPRYIEKNPGSAAIRFDGEASPHQVALTEIAEGEYGKRALEMIEYIAKQYPVQIINLTELSYYDYSFGDQDLRSYKAHTGKSGWPLDRKKKINKNDPSVWEWKSALMERFIEKAARLAHENRKELYVDVPVSWKDFSRNGKESGLDYRRILRHADKIIVWNYFSLANQPPEASEALARYLVENFPGNAFYVSIGLWGKSKRLASGPFAKAVASTVKGGATHLWMTPNDMVTEQHWNALLQYWKK